MKGQEGESYGMMGSHVPAGDAHCCEECCKAWNGSRPHPHLIGKNRALHFPWPGLALRTSRAQLEVPWPCLLPAGCTGPLIKDGCSPSPGQRHLPPVSAVLCPLCFILSQCCSGTFLNISPGCTSRMWGPWVFLLCCSAGLADGKTSGKGFVPEEMD